MKFIIILNNLIMFYDSNNVQLSTNVSDISSENIKQKYESFGWKVLEIDGNSVGEIDAALTIAKNEKYAPTLIIGHTTMAKHAIDINGNSLEGKISTHGQSLSKAKGSVQHTMDKLGGDLTNPFNIFEDVQKSIAMIIEEKVEAAYTRPISPLNNCVNIDLSSLSKLEENISTRRASGHILEHLALKHDNFVCGSADMCTTDYSSYFLKNTSAISKSNSAGRFLQCGVSELTMAAIMNGIALHGGFIPICSTYLIFSDYMKPAMRLAAMMRLPVKYMFSHDDFRVGEDGATHQPIEQEAQLRLLEKIKNSNGNPSLYVFRPANTEETYISWNKMLSLEEPAVILLTKQPVESFENTNINDKGGYRVDNVQDPELILVANGSDVGLAIKVQTRLKEKNVKASVVSIYSFGLFNTQSSEYCRHILPSNTMKYGITSGVYSNLLEFIKDENKIYGMCTYGMSAPAESLENHFGYTVENISSQIGRSML